MTDAPDKTQPDAADSTDSAGEPSADEIPEDVFVTISTPEQIAQAVLQVLQDNEHEEPHLTLAAPDRHVIQTRNADGRNVTITIEYTR